MEPYDVTAFIKEKIASQFRESEKLRGYIEALASEVAGLEAAAFDVILQRWIDSAVGVQLDVLGILVGQPRAVVNASDLFYFGFVGAYHALGFGQARLALQGEVTGGVRYLIDEEYRGFIRARIAKNHCRATVNAVVELTEFLLGGSAGDPPVIVNELPNAKMQVAIGKYVDLNTRILLLESGLFPKPAGVGVEFLYFEGVPFGFLGAPGVAGFGVGVLASVGEPPNVGSMNFELPEYSGLAALI